MRNILNYKLKHFFDKTFSGSRKGIEDVIVSMIPQSVSAVTGFVASVLIARGLGPKGMGNYALILSVSGLAAALSDLGIGQTAIRFASQAAERKDTTNQLAILRWAFRLRMLFVFLTSLIAFAFTPFVADKLWHEISLTPLVRLSLLTGIFTAIAAIPTIYFQSLKRFRMNAVVAVAQTLVSFIGIIIIAFLNKWSLELVIVVSVVATGLGAITFIMLVPKASFIALQDFRQPFTKLLKCLWCAPKHNPNDTTSLDTTGANKFAFFMLVSSVMVTIAMRADVWLMGYYLDKSQIGLYSVASRFTLPLVIVLGALNTALWPRASALTSFKKTTEMIGKTFRLSILVAIIALLYSILAPLATSYIFGSSYTEGILIGQILCLRYCISILTCPVGVIGYSFGLVRVYWWINILQLISVIVVNVYLLPQIGAMGSALALIANEIVGFVLVAIIVWRKFVDMRATPECC